MNKKINAVKKIIFVFVLSILTSGYAFSQIEGMMSDQKKTAVLNAVITATDSTGNIIDTVKSDKRGGYAFKGLKPGKYNIEAKAAGFLTAIYKNIEVTPAPEGTDEGDDTYWAIRLDITLMPPKVPKQ